MMSEVTDDGGTVRIAIPLPPLHPVAIVGGLFPAVIAMAMLSWLRLLSTPPPLAPIEWIFIALLFAGFGVLPAASVVSRWFRSRVGRTIVTVSPQELRVQERGIRSSGERLRMLPDTFGQPHEPSPTDDELQSSKPQCRFARGILRPRRAQAKQ